MKKKVLLSSALTIAICLCLIAGSTFALFTDSSRLDIEVTAGDVAIDADISNLTLWSVTPDATGDVIDETGSRYSYENQNAKGMFLNTGKAAFDGNVLNIERITPGDKVSFNIECANTSDVSILMRYTVKLDTSAANDLASGMVFSADGLTYTGVTSYTSVWVPVAVGDAMPSVPVELGLPVYAGNKYQSTGVSYIVLVEAVQGNAAVSYDKPIVDCVNVLADDVADLNAALVNPTIEDIVLFGDFSKGVTLDGAIAGKTIDANDKNVSFVVAATAKLNDVTFANLRGYYTGAAVTFKSGAAGNVTIKDSTINEATGKEAILLGGHNELVLNVESCEFDGGKYAVRSTGNVNAVNVSNTVFENKSGWAVLLNGAVLDTLSITDCQFINCADGVAKAGVGSDAYAGVVAKEFEFVNNIIENCFGHDYHKNLGTAKEQGPEANMIAVSYLAGTTLTINGNVKDGALWTPGENQGIVQK